MNWEWTPQRVYDRLGYDPPEIFAANARAERYTSLRSTVPHEVLEQEKDRCTGRTTTILAEAVAHVMNGYSVVIGGRARSDDAGLVERARSMLFALATPAQRGQVEWGERASRIEPWSEMNVGTRAVVLFDHRAP